MVLLGNLSHPAAPAPAGDLARLDADERAPATRRAYAVRHLVRGAGDRGPRGPRRRGVAAYLAGRAERSKLATVRSAAAAIAAACRAAGRPDPTKTPLVADALRGIGRQQGGRPRAATRCGAATQATGRTSATPSTSCGKPRAATRRPSAATGSRRTPAIAEPMLPAGPPAGT